jgi:hypothetical protein
MFLSLSHFRPEGEKPSFSEKLGFFFPFEPISENLFKDLTRKEKR